MIAPDNKSPQSTDTQLKAVTSCDSRPSPGNPTEEEVVLTSIGLVWDDGLCAEGVPREDWGVYAAGAVCGADLRLATFPTAEWEAPEAAEIAAACGSIGYLLEAVAELGTSAFADLTPQAREQLTQAAGAITGVARVMFHGRDQVPLPTPPLPQPDWPSLREVSRRATLSVDEVAGVLGIGRAAAYQAVARGDLPSIRIGRRLLIPVPALLAVLGDIRS